MASVSNSAFRFKYEYSKHQTQLPFDDDIFNQYLQQASELALITPDAREKTVDHINNRKNTNPSPTQASLAIQPHHARRLQLCCTSTLPPNIARPHTLREFQPPSLDPPPIYADSTLTKRLYRKLPSNPPPHSQQSPAQSNHHLSIPHAHATDPRHQRHSPHQHLPHPLPRLQRSHLRLARPRSRKMGVRNRRLADPLALDLHMRLPPNDRIQHHNHYRRICLRLPQRLVHRRNLHRPRLPYQLHRL